MSCDIRLYTARHFDSSPYQPDDLSVHAFVGPEGNRGAVQFTIRDRYCLLFEDEVRDLIDTLQKRLANEEGYTATGSERDDIEYRG